VDELKALIPKEGLLQHLLDLFLHFLPHRLIKTRAINSVEQEESSLLTYLLLP
jgi:hypothetical protein